MPASTSPRPVTRDQVIAYRLAAQHLGRRAPAGELVAVAAMGLHDPTVGTAGQALHARLDDLTPADVDRALHVDKTLVRLWSLRMAPYVVPAADLALFTAGIRPADTAARMAFVMGASASLAEAGFGIDALVDRTAAGMREALDGRALPKHQLVLEIAEAIAADLPPARRDAWYQDARYVESNSLGEMLVSFALRIVALDGGFCSIQRAGDAREESVFVRTDQWLGKPVPDVAPEVARAALLRRFLRAFGPATAKHFAEWASLGKAEAEAAWAAMAPALVPLALGKRTAWLHADDERAFDEAPPPRGVRLLPPYDPWLAPRDRETIVPAKERHKVLWRSVGNPGVVLADGEVVATWKAKRAGTKLKLEVAPFGALPAAVARAVEAEAAGLAPFRGAERVEIVRPGA